MYKTIEGERCFVFTSTGGLEEIHPLPKDTGHTLMHLIKYAKGHYNEDGYSNSTPMDFDGMRIIIGKAMLVPAECISIRDILHHVSTIWSDYVEPNTHRDLQSLLVDMFFLHDEPVTPERLIINMMSDMRNTYAWVFPEIPDNDKEFLDLWKPRDTICLSRSNT
jgi:hypothetical protein